MDFKDAQHKKIIFYITYTVLLLVALYNYRVLLDVFWLIFDLILPFILGLCIAFIINVLLKVIEGFLYKKGARLSKNKLAVKIKRPLSLTITLLVVFGCVIILFVLIIPEMSNTISMLILKAPELIKETQIFFNNIRNDLRLDFLPDLTIDWNKIGQTITTFVQNGGIHVFRATTSVIATVINLSIGFVFAIYILLQKEKLAGQTKRFFYAYFKQHKVDHFLEIKNLSSRIFSRFIVGQLLEAVIIGVMCFVGMLILRLPYAGTISALVGFTALIPVIGAFIGTGLGALLILMVSPIQALIFIIYILVIQQIDGNIIYPKVVGNAIGLPGIWVLMAVTLGASIYGIVGMLISVPLCSVIYSLLRTNVNKRLAEKQIQIENES